MGSDENCCVGMGKFLAFLAVLTFLLHAASMANPYWIEKEYTVHAPVPGVIFAELESHIGLLWACTDQNIPAMKIDKYECESLGEVDKDVVEDWQCIAAGFGCAALLCNFIALILSFVVFCSSDRAMCIRFGAICCYFLACVMFLVVLILFKENKEVSMTMSGVKISLDYDFNWGYYVAAAADCMFFVMALFHLFVVCGVRNANTIV